ncbi:MAG TPA: hypothetical protein VK875_11270, partial [Euzebyales bacterium]|nr:hypothetical protein [Euzebyales bacterium]
PPGLRTRLDARLRAERAERAAHAQPVERGDHLQRVAADAAGPPPAATAAAPATTPATARARWRQRWRGAPFAAAAAVVLVAVIGGAALLGQSGSMDEVATDSAGGEAADATAAAPFAAPEAGDDAGTLEAQEDSGNAQADDRSSTTADGDGAEAVPALPRVRDDDDIAARLDDPERATDDPPGAEAALRLRYGLAPQPLCLAGVDAAAVDIVEVDGAAVLSTLERGDDGRQVALYDVGLCSRLRTFAP